MKETDADALLIPRANPRVPLFLLLGPLPCILLILLLAIGAGLLVSLVTGQDSALTAEMSGWVEVIGFGLSIPFLLALCAAPIGIILCFTRWGASRNRFINVLLWVDIALLVVICVGSSVLLWQSVHAPPV